MCVVLKLLHSIDMVLHLRIKGDKEVFPSLVQDPIIFSNFEIISEQNGVVAYEHVHQTPRPKVGFRFTFIDRFYEYVV